MDNYLNRIRLPSLLPLDSQVLDTPFQKNTLLLAIDRSKKQKAPGPDGYPAELFCICQDLLLDPLFELFNKSY